jgi:branched-chain amino acid transport system permease protein
MLAGIAGALITQTNQFVGLNVLGFESAGELLVMLILGGVGRIYGAFVGPLVYLVAQDFLAKQFPEYWYLGIGLILIVVVMFARGGILGIVDVILAPFHAATGQTPSPSPTSGKTATSRGFFARLRRKA